VMVVLKKVMVPFLFDPEEHRFGQSPLRGVGWSEPVSIKQGIRSRPVDLGLVLTARR